MKYGTIDEIVANLTCPDCKYGLVGKRGGVRCGVPGNRFSDKLNKGRGGWTKCEFGFWLEPFEDEKNKFLIRPNDYPKIDFPTCEQVKIWDWFGGAGRCLVVDAGPGCGKTTTVAWAARALKRRVRDLSSYYFAAFNRNAKLVLQSNLPWEVPVLTLNALGGRLQGKIGKDYDPDKLEKVLEALQSRARDKVELGQMADVVERLRAMCLFHPNPDAVWWADAIRVVAARFGVEVQAGWAKWVPALMVAAHREAATIDLGEQYARPVLEAIARTGYELPLACASRDHVWTDEEVRSFAGLVREIRVCGSSRGFVIDEAQDLSLAMMALYLAASYRGSEVVLIGDDRVEGVKAGQAVYGWRGAFPGSMTLWRRLWVELTGERADELPLTVTFRCAPEIVRSFRALNKVLVSGRGPGGRAVRAAEDRAFAMWLEGDDKTSLWVTRTNRAAARIFLRTVKNKVKCGFRGEYNFAAQVGAVFHKCCGRRDDQGEYACTVEEAKEKLRKCVRDEGCMEAFVLAVMEEAAGLTAGGVRRLLLSYCDGAAARTVSTVYRCKGEEADRVFVSDDEAMNAAWGGDVCESEAVRHVALSRARDVLVVVGHVAGFEPDKICPGT